VNETVRELVNVLTEVLRSRRPRPSLEAATNVAAERELWSELQDLGFTLTSASGSDGGADGSEWHAAAVVHTAARLGVSLPLGETGLLASWALSAAGVAVPVAMMTWASVDDGLSVQPGTASGLLRVTGRVRAVPHARTAETLLVADFAAGKLILVPLDRCLIRQAENLGAEPRDDVSIDGVDIARASVIPLPGTVRADSVSAREALVRTLCIAGALERVTELAAKYATQRIQFGRPIASFQAVRHYIAQMVAETAAVNAAVAAAVAGLESADDAATVLPVAAAAKIRAGRAVRIVTKLAHQIHGAIGYTTEHELHVHTRRLWAWREEGGTEEAWAALLGRRACSGQFDIWRTG
jgi:acyl-CoA dehydrogenase